jgi:integrase
MAKKFRAKRKPGEPRRKGTPRYCGPHATGQAYSIWPAGTPKAGKPRYHGSYGTPESRENYRRWLAELGVDKAAAGDAMRPLLTIAEGWEAWLDAVEKRGWYQKHGKATDTKKGFRSAMKYVLDLYASMLLQDFTAYHLNVARRAMIEKGLRRHTINEYTGRIRHVWDFFLTEGLIDKADYVAVEACRVLRQNQGGVESGPVLSVPESHVKAVLAEVTPAIRTMIEVCCWSGCRQGEIRVARTCDITDEDALIPPRLQGQCWVFRPHIYKTEHHGKTRIVLLGPQAMAAMEPWLQPTDPEKYLFLPYESQVYASRKRQLKPGNVAGTERAKRNTLPLDRPYGKTAMWSAIDRACDKLNLPHWHPHQLRHLAATRLAERYGVEITQILLGHCDVKTTLKYVDPNVITPDDRQRYAAAIKAIAEHG